ncbi:hypothetical protein CQW23_23306 [Capsicum baccatum]|uniref:Uncharacterized protein n=1 Tax=Capsicum baccatum TaxID=33114 RepID=A0A2G2VRL4_CAPBA|nr:hypothetical protein CQW23_23306 [Capsicum baccatum]
MMVLRCVMAAFGQSLEGSSKVKIPEPKPFGGARSAKGLENFLWDMEQYLSTAQVAEMDKLNITTIKGLRRKGRGRKRDEMTRLTKSTTQLILEHQEQRENSNTKGFYPNRERVNVMLARNMNQGGGDEVVIALVNPLGVSLNHISLLIVVGESSNPFNPNGALIHREMKVDGNRMMAMVDTEPNILLWMPKLLQNMD